MAVAAPRGRADRDEHRLGAAHGLGQVGVKDSRPSRTFLATRSRQARLEDRHLAAVERVDLGRVLVDAADVVAEIGKAGPGHQTDIAAIRSSRHA